MASKVDPESEAQTPDDAQAVTLDTSGLEVTGVQLEELMKSMQLLLSDVGQLRSQCSHQARELTAAALDLRQQQEELKESYMDLSKDLQEIMDTMGDLFTTKSDFETKEQQVQKLNRKL